MSDAATVPEHGESRSTSATKSATSGSTDDKPYAPKREKPVLRKSKPGPDREDLGRVVIKPSSAEHARIRQLEDTCQKLHDKLSRAEDDRKKAIDQWTRTSSQLKNAQDDARKSQESYRFQSKLQASLEEMTSERNRLRREADEAHVSGQEAISEVIQLKQAKQRQSNRIQELMMEVQDLRAHINRQESSVTRAQQAAMSLLSQAVSTSLPDDQVRKRFGELFENVAAWARENASTDMSVLNDVEMLEKLDKEWLFIRPDPRARHHSLSFDLEDETAIDTLLNAALAKKLCDTFLERPFFFADRTHPMTRSEPEYVGTNDILHGILQKLLKGHGNPSAAYAWRATTVGVLSSGEEAKKALNDVYNETTTEFLRKYACLINPGITVDEQQQLRDVVVDFGEFALQLWSQKYDVKYQTLKQLECRSFSVTAEDMEAARAVRLDENDTALDGRPIQAVVQPLIEGYGTPEGKEYDKRKIWSRAVVWISNKNRPEPQPVIRRKSLKVNEDRPPPVPPK